MPDRHITHHIDAPKGEVDERWITDWVRYGLDDCERYLARHAAFDRYCAEHTTDQEGS